MTIKFDVEKFKKYSGRDEIDTGVAVKTSSTLPVASGLSSSSAASNAVLITILFGLKFLFYLHPIVEFYFVLELINNLLIR